MAEDETVRRVHVSERVVELRVDEEHGRPGLFDDVPDVVGVEPKVDRHDDASRNGEQRDE